MASLDVITIKLFSLNYIEEARAEVCNTIVQSAVSALDINRTKVKFYSDIHTRELRSPEHQRYIPTLTNDEKLDMLYAYIVVAEALEKENIEFFMVEGSLLGVHRHQGLIPWDDDVDIAVNVSFWKKVRTVLGCIDGFVLEISKEMHWKFHRNSTQPRLGFPFIDIFFYNENEEYIWAVTHYLVQSVIYPKRYVFPLTTASYEGLTVPVPKETDYLLRTQFDFETCQSPSSSHKTGVRYKVSNIPCSSLSYLYKMFNLQF